MGKYLIKRILAMIPMLLLISLLVFIALEFTPGDPLTSILSPEQASKLTEEQIEAFREANGLNGSFPERYISWLGRTLTGNFGNSLVSGAPVTKLLGVRVPATLEIVTYFPFTTTVSRLRSLGSIGRDNQSNRFFRTPGI